ncbi:hypothetical protein EW146_g4679 [Bondarzewia mesenterica]|uniref:BTB domain-containing protein n=1 Tax=Bondarzewia mesenterica TaxID=1095465 RepID=A0A4S4LTU5_9AGAM|nr:hypothetical protein EW146_g4679 [Bondarzewia mesenterica]
MEMDSYSQQRHLSQPLKRLRTISLDFEGSAASPSSSTRSVPIIQANNLDSKDESHLPVAKRRQYEGTHSQDSILDSRYENHIKPSFKPYWFEDGDVILVVGDHLFKLGRKMLTCSEIFEDMFLLAQPQDTGIFEGCPVVHLTDKPQDWMMVLQWMDNPQQFWQRREILYETIAGTLRISTKYEIPELRRIAVKHVHRIWPRNLRRMDDRAFSRHRLGISIIPPPLNIPNVHPFSVCADALALARECDLPDILPAIVYSLSIDFLHNDLVQDLHFALLLPDQQRIIKVSERLSAFHDNTLLELRSHISDMCGDCGTSLLSYWARELDLKKGQMRRWLLAQLDGMREDTPSGVCHDCLGAHYHLVESQLTLLESMLNVFGL